MGNSQEMIGQESENKSKQFIKISKYQAHLRNSLEPIKKKRIFREEQQTKSQLFEEKIFEKDTRIMIGKQKMQSYPFCMIGLIRNTFNPSENSGNQQENQQMVTINGTGCLVSPDLVLTVAHNIYCKGKGINGLPNDCIFKLGLCGNDFVLYEGVQFFIPQEYIDLCLNNKNERRMFDYALIRVKPEEENVRKVIEYMPLAYYSDFINGENLEVYGYPEDLNQLRCGKSMNNSIKIKFMFGERGKLLDAEDGMLKYQINTCIGQSGSPVILKNKQGKYEIIGVHNGPNFSRTYNEAVSIGLMKNILGSKWKLNLEVKYIIHEVEKKKMLMESWKFSNRDKSDQIQKMVDAQIYFTDLKLDNYSLGDIGVFVLTQYITNTNFKQLSLHSNHISSAGVVWLTSIQWPALEYLSLGNNHIKTLQNWKIANIRSLKLLWLWNNFISEISENISELVHLHTLDLEGNQFTEIPTRLLKMKLNCLYIQKNKIDFKSKTNEERLRKLQLLQIQKFTFGDQKVIVYF